MPTRTWTLTDTARDIYLDKLKVGHAEVGGTAQEYSVAKRRLAGGLRDGVDLVEIDNGRLRVAAVPTRGMGLWKAWHGDWEIGWQSGNDKLVEVEGMLQILETMLTQIPNCHPFGQVLDNEFTGRL